MPTRCSSDVEGCYCRWGGHGKKYKYKCGDEEGKKRAQDKANKQGRAIHSPKNKNAYSTGFKGGNLVWT